MTDSEITIKILGQIRDELVTTRTELKAELVRTNERIDVTNERLDVTNERLSTVETVVRDAAQQIRMVGSYVKNKHEVAIDDLRERVSKLEEKVG